jgi:hypothetical protein
LLSALNLAASKGKSGKRAPSPSSIVILGHVDLLVVRPTSEIQQQIEQLLALMKAARSAGR